VFGHSVARLCERYAAYDSSFNKLKPKVKNLDQFSIEARYPNGLPDLVPAEFYGRDEPARFPWPQSTPYHL